MKATALLAALACALLTSCGRDDKPSADSPPSSPNTIGSEGGTVAVHEPGSPIDGLKIEVPAGAMPEAQAFEITHRPYLGDLPENLTSLTPVIEVENGGAFAEEVMTVTVPIDLPEDHFAMGFFVGADGELEPMPLVDLTPTSITVATRHFSDIMVNAIAEAMLFGEISVTTGFLPGRDDWQFTNRGSYIAPGGHCAGQCLSAVWYYYEKRLKGEKPLHGRFDNNLGPATPTLWYDDRNAYRFASTVQRDIQWGTELRKMLNAMAKTSPTLTWKSFLFAMQATGEPQYVSVYDTDGKGGHALVAYAAEVIGPDAGALLIADPNYPKQSRRRIFFQGGKFKPYLSGANAEEIKKGNSKSYEEIRYNAKTALVPWSKIGARWEQFTNSTIGDDRFPEYQLVYTDKDGSSKELPEKLKVTEPKLGIGLHSKTNPRLTLRLVYGSPGAWNLTDAWNGATLPLNAGSNRYGVVVTGKVKRTVKVKVKKMVPQTVGGQVVQKEVVTTENKVVEIEKWVDFRWVEITRAEEKKDPPPVTKPPPPGPGTVVIGTYYGMLKTNTRSSGNLLFLVSANEDVVLPNAYEILYEKKDDTGKVLFTRFRFSTGISSPRIPAGYWKVCAGPRVGSWWEKSRVFGTGDSVKITGVEVGSKPPD